MNREQLRSKIPHNHRIVLAKLAETTNMPVKYFYARYFAYEKDKQIFIEDVRLIIDGIQSGTYELNYNTFDLEKVKKENAGECS